MQKLVYNQSKQSDKNKLTDEELDDLYKEHYSDFLHRPSEFKAGWIMGFRASEDKHVKDVWKLRKVIKGYIHALGTMYREKHEHDE